MSKKDEKRMALASYYASLSNMRCHHGCVIILNGNVIAHGYNNLRNYSKDHLIDDVSCHAEISALRNALKRLKLNPNRDKTVIHRMKLYVARIGTNGCFLDSKPCLQCYVTLKNAGVTNIIYSNSYCLNKMDIREDHGCKSSSGLKLVNQLCLNPN